MNIMVRFLQQDINFSKIKKYYLQLIIFWNLDNSTNTTAPSDLLNEKKCDLFGGFSFFVQFILGILSFMVLVCKF